jgi:SNF2 family DNA or RNA helicase
MLRHFDSNREKCLVFSWSTQTLDVIEALCHTRGWNSARLDGSVAPSQRQRLVDEFNNSPSSFVFLCSTRAGGVGINLQSATKVGEREWL